jgi:hypothetical protein
VPIAPSVIITAGPIRIIAVAERDADTEAVVRPGPEATAIIIASAAVIATIVVSTAASVVSASATRITPASAVVVTASA